MIPVVCHQCDRVFDVPDEAAGRKVRCPHCEAYARVSASPPVVHISHPLLDALWGLSQFLVDKTLLLVVAGLAILVIIFVGYLIYAAAH